MRRLLTLLAVVALSLALVATAGAQPEAPRLDGEWVVLDHSDFDAEVGDLIVMRPDGSELMNLTNGDGHHIEGELSPDGTAIAFTSVDDTGFKTIWLMDVDGDNRRQISPGYGITPTWTPDGLSVVYAGSNDIRIVQRNGDDDRAIGMVDGRPVREPSVSPDGSAIAFDATTTDEGDRELFTLPIEGGEATQITTEGGFEPEWSPVGDRILFTTFRGDFGDNIWATKPDGTEQETLVPSPDNDFNGTWSPDGSRVMYESVKQGAVAIVVHDRVDGTYVEVLSTPPDGRTYRRPTWTEVTLDRLTVPPPTTTTTAAADTTSTSIDPADTTTTVAAVPGEASDATTDWVVIGLAGAILVLAAFGAGMVVGSRWGRDQPPPPPPPA